MDFPVSNFLIYNCWETKRPGQSTIAGDNLVDCAMTEEEAAEKVKMYEARSDEFNKKFPVLNKNTTSRFAVIKNRSEWWNRIRDTNRNVVPATLA